MSIKIRQKTGFLRILQNYTIDSRILGLENYISTIYIHHDEKHQVFKTISLPIGVKSIIGPKFEQNRVYQEFSIILQAIQEIDASKIIANQLAFIFTSKVQVWIILHKFIN